MGYTSTAVKAKYNKKTYSSWSSAIRKEIFEQIEELRAKEGMSRSEFLLMLIKEKYGESAIVSQNDVK